MSGPYDLSLDTLDQQEGDTILNSLNADIAFEIGSLLRDNARKESSKAVLIQIYASNGVVLFQAASRPGVNPDNEQWVIRKRKTVERFHRATFYMGCKLRAEGRSLSSAFFIDETEFCSHGGGFPIRVRGIEGIVGVIVVSGLAQHLDHDLIVRVLKNYIASEAATNKA